MITKILSKTASFNAVRYNTDKIKNGEGELMTHENFPIPQNVIPKTAVVKNYLKAFSNTNSRVKNPQFHATISCAGKEFDKYQLTEIAKEYMGRMGYGKQPYIVVFHNDTNNNHVHIVSTRINQNGKKISDQFENLKSQKYMQQILREKYNIDEKQNLKPLLKYKVSSFAQMRTLLETKGFELVEKNGANKVYKSGILQLDNIQIEASAADKKRQKQIQHIVKNQAQSFDCLLKKKQNTWSSPLTEQLKKQSGLEFVFHTSKKTGEVFGYTLIDHKHKNVFKGSEILDLKYMKGQIPIEQLYIRDKDTDTSREDLKNSIDNTIILEQITGAKLGSVIGSALSAAITANQANSNNNQKRKRKR